MVRTSAAIWPTTWRSDPLITISVGVGHSTLTPAGISLTTGCEKPTCRFSLLPCAWARNPTPTGVAGHAHQGVNRARKRAERTLDAEPSVGDRHVHALRDGDRHLSYAGHC